MNNVSIETTILIALISAGLAALVNGIFQIINRCLDSSKEKNEQEQEEKKAYRLKKEEVYLIAIERLQDIKKGFYYTSEQLSNNKELRSQVLNKEQSFEALVAKLRLYAPDDIYNCYNQLASFSRFSYASQMGPRLIGNYKDWFGQQIFILSRLMQQDLGYRIYNDNNTLIICPDCATEHDAYAPCPKCGMKYSKYMDIERVNALIMANSPETLGPYPKEGYDSYFLMKFMGSYKFQQDFLDGKLYFNTSDFFMMCDKKGQGDDAEGNEWKINPKKDELKSANLRIVDGQAIIEIVDYSQHPENYQPGTIFSYSPAINRFRKVISFYTLYANSIENRLQSQSEDMSKIFGEYGVLILDTEELFIRIIDGIKKLGNVKSAQLGYVDYLNENEEKGFTEYNPFIKGHDYAYQNEFRVTFVDDTKEPVLLDVGNLRDIAVPMFKDSFRDMYMKGGKLFYPTYTVTEIEESNETKAHLGSN